MPSRRQFLRGTTAALGAGALTALAGCNSLPLVGGGHEAYTKWVPEADEYGDSDHVGVVHLDATALREHEDSFDEDYYTFDDDFEFDFLDLDLDDLSALTFSAGGADISGPTGLSGTGTHFALEGDFEKETVTDALDDTDGSELVEMTDDGTDGDYDLYVPDSESVDGSVLTIAVSAGAVVWASSQQDALDAGDLVEASIDAEAGEAARHVEEHEDFRALAEAVGAGTIVGVATSEPREETTIEAGRFEGVVASGTRMGVGGETTDIQAVKRFEGESDADTGDIEDWTDEQVNWSEADDVQVSQDGRTVTVTGTIDTDDVRDESAQVTQENGPQASFAFDWTAPESGDRYGTLEITMQSGDTMPVEELFVRGAGIETNGSGRWDQQDGYENQDDAEVTSGDRIAVGAASDFRVHLTWEPPGQDISVVLSEQRGPDA